MSRATKPISQEMVVCHLIGSLRVGGAERQFANILNQLPVAKKIALFLREPEVESLANVLDARIPRATIGMRLHAAPLHIVRMAYQLRRWRVSVLHTHMYWANLYGALAGRLAGVPVIVTSEHGRDVWKGAAGEWVERNVITPLVDKRLCVSGDILDHRRDVYGIPESKLAVLQNGTLVPEVPPRLEQEPPLIGSLGRLIDLKDFRTLIHAAAVLRDRNVRFQLVIFGEGEQRAALEAEIKLLNLGGIVSLPGVTQDTAGWLTRFSVFAMSSISEGQPMALLEAMAHGLPIVATGVGGIPDTVVDGVEGLLMPPGDSVSLAEALARVLANRALAHQFGQAARKRVLNDFSIQASCDRLVSVYRELLSAKGLVVCE